MEHNNWIVVQTRVWIASLSAAPFFFGAHFSPSVQVFTNWVNKVLANHFGEGGEQIMRFRCIRVSLSSFSLLFFFLFARQRPR